MKTLVYLVWKGALKDVWCQILLCLPMLNYNFLQYESMDCKERRRMEASETCFVQVLTWLLEFPWNRSQNLCFGICV